MELQLPFLSETGPVWYSDAVILSLFRPVRGAIRPSDTGDSLPNKVTGRITRYRSIFFALYNR